MARSLCWLLVAWLVIASSSAQAENATVAVAANFVVPMESLKRRFESQSGHRLILVPGSTGQLYAQILNGAPFDVLLAADRLRPSRLAAEGFADSASQFTYARGRVVLWSANPAFDDLGIEILASDRFRHLAMASPELAPYGLAAKQVLEHLGLGELLSTRTAFGQNVGQAFAMVATGTAELGLVALSQALQYGEAANYVIVPASYHEPIEQDALLLNHGRDNTAAHAVMEFLNSAQARDLILDFGYAATD